MEGLRSWSEMTPLPTQKAAREEREGRLTKKDRRKEKKRKGRGGKKKLNDQKESKKPKTHSQRCFCS